MSAKLVAHNVILWKICTAIVKMFVCGGDGGGGGGGGGVVVVEGSFAGIVRRFAVAA